jgi:hypothetical protein
MALILSGWIFFLATDELATINYLRKKEKQKTPGQTNTTHNQTN